MTQTIVPGILSRLRRVIWDIAKASFHCTSKLSTLPKALWTQALTALTSNFGLVGLVVSSVGLVWFGMFGLVDLVW